MTNDRFHITLLLFENTRYKDEIRVKKKNIKQSCKKILIETGTYSIQQKQ